MRLMAGIYLGMEDAESSIEVTAEEEAHAERVLQETQNCEDSAVVEVEQELDQKQTVVNEMTALESFHAILAHGIEHQAYSTQMAAASDAYLRRYRELGLLPTQTGLEHYGRDTIADYYTVSAEGIKELWSRFKKGVGDRYAYNATASNEMKRSSQRKMRARALTVKANALLSRLKDMPSGEVTVELGSHVKAFSTQGMVSQKIAKDIQSDLTVLSYVFSTYVPDTQKWFEDVRKATKVAVGEYTMAPTSHLTDSLALVKRLVGDQNFPPAAFSKPAIEGSGVLNNSLILYLPEIAKTDSTLDQFYAISKSPVPHYTQFAVKPKSAGHVVVKKADVKVLLQSLLTYAKILERATTETEGLLKRLTTEMGNIFPDVGLEQDRGEGWLLCESLMIMTMFAPTYLEYMLTSAYEHIGKVTDAIIHVSELAVIPPAAEESV